MSELTDLDAGSLLERLRAREVSAVDVVRAFLRRIEAVDGELNAFVRINPEAERQAAELDRMSGGDLDRPLAGLPVAVKDNICTAGLETTCGSRILGDFVPSGDATAVARLHDAGAIVLGKTNMDEFGMGSSNENSAVGPVRNPWDPDRVPGGSSGGSAVAVSARMAPVALGSDTGGSVRQPAALCGVVGLKPTYGRVSRLGLVAFGSSLDQIGPLTRSVADAALLLEVIAGADPLEATSSKSAPGSYVQACDHGVGGMRIGIPAEYFERGLDASIERAVRAAAGELERQGARVEEVSLPHTRWAIPTYYLVAAAEASSNLARYDAVRYGRRIDPGRGLQEMYGASRGRGFGVEVKRRIMLGTYALSAGYYDAFYRKALCARTRVRDDFLRIFAAGLDLLLTPTTPTTAFRLGEKLDDPLAMYLSDAYTTTANLAGLPAMSVPLGTDDRGLPVGGQLIGPDFGEEALFRAASVIERRWPPAAPPIARSNPAAEGN